MRNIPNYERETIIRWYADEKIATCSTSDPVTMRKLDKLCQEFPDSFSRTHELSDTHDARYTLPVDRIRYLKPASEAQKEAGKRVALFNRLNVKQACEISTSGGEDDTQVG